MDTLDGRLVKASYECAEIFRHTFSSTVLKNSSFGRVAVYAAGLVALVTFPAAAFESDVHFGLTQWLALQAGYDAQQALAIASGDQRVDSGDIQFEQTIYSYACPGLDLDQSQLAGRLHFPTDVRPPAPPGQREVLAGGAAATKQSNEILKTPQVKAPFMLLKLGEALHPLQDSWSNQGVPGAPQLPAELPGCHADAVWGVPQSRGGWNSHRADATSLWPADVLAMAQATYEILQRFPQLSPGVRAARDWTGLAPQLADFIKASTKSAKADWFRAHGIQDVAFLQGMSLPDGARSFEPKWPGRKLPPLSSMHSGQHGVGQDALDFFSTFFADWASASKFEGIATKYGAAEGDASTAIAKRELSARLGLWRIADHGKVAQLAHAQAPLTQRQLADAEALIRKPGALAQYAAPAEAYFPLLPRTGHMGVSPLAAFIVVPLADSSPGNPRALATAKFFHTPYDALAVVAEYRASRWCITGLTAIVEH